MGRGSRRSPRRGGDSVSGRVVITGAAGFIGSHLTDALIDRGFSVVGIDNLLTGNLANLAHLAGRDFTFIKQDVTNYINLDGAVDFVLHWASPASPIDYLNFPIPTLKVGALGTHNALGLALAKKVTFVLASTSEVYGDPLEHPQSERYWGNVNPIGPRGVYDEAKRFAEAMTTAYHRYHGLDAKIVRIFNTYGPRMRVNDGRAVPNFIRQALKNEDVTVYGRGDQTRSFCFITDLVGGIIRLMCTPRRTNPSTLATRPRCRSNRWLPKSSTRSALRHGSCTSRCQSTTRRFVNLISRVRAPSSSGNHRSRSRTDWRRRSSTFGDRWCERYP